MQSSVVTLLLLQTPLLKGASRIEKSHVEACIFGSLAADTSKVLFAYKRADTISHAPEEVTCAQENVAQFDSCTCEH